MDLRKFVTPEIVHGSGARHLAGTYARNIGATRVLVVSDPGVVAAGWTAEVVRSLEREGLVTHLFTGVTPNPRTTEVALGAELSLEHECDAIVAVGGGSPMDCAKGIGIVLANERQILEFEGVDRITSPIPPLLCVPTTSGSAADVSQFAIFTEREERLKFAVISKAIVPDVALIDADTTRTLSPYVIACTAMDAFVHAIEAFVSNASSPLTDAYALSAVTRTVESLPGALHDPADLLPRGSLMVASLEAGLAFSNASLGATHAMAHAVGGLVDNPHGEANAMLIEHVIAFNYAAAPERHDQIAARLGVRVAELSPNARRHALIGAVRGMKKAIGLDLRLRDRGVTRSDLPVMAQTAFSDPCMATNPRPVTVDDVECIYEEAL
ncbi:MAG TPA: alcohol dehydrogenase-like regulatory protein ErcA [Anaeromyxobacter sp.]|nr:alcohol dehydrogenase-like regulatory protein ErcA [Anaeromyxobacter sp.]